jgi:hypothetical protein
MLKLDRGVTEAKDDLQNLYFTLVFNFDHVEKGQQGLGIYQETDVYIHRRYNGGHGNCIIGDDPPQINLAICHWDSNIKTNVITTHSKLLTIKVYVLSNK